MYNTTNFTDAKNFYDIVLAVNQESGSLFGNILLFTIYVALILMFLRSEKDFIESMLISSTITTTLSVLLWTLNLISWQTIMIPLIATLISLFTKIFKG